MEISPVKFNNSVCNVNKTAPKNNLSFSANQTATVPQKTDNDAYYIYTFMPFLYLNQNDRQKYLYLAANLRNNQISQNSQTLTPTGQLDRLLKNGKLLAKSKDGSTTLDNLYEMAKTQRADGLDNLTLVKNTLDILSNPRVITQKFGDIPENEKQGILASISNYDEVKQAPEMMDVRASGTCAAASNEVNLADKYPAEFARWVNGLSSPEKAVYLDLPLKAICQNNLDALTILRLMDAQVSDFSFDKVKLKVSPDDNAYIRANIQTNNWDYGERTPVDVLIQSAIMQLGTQNTYNSLSDTRGGEFSTNSQGLIEIEKTFVETVLKGKEITSLVYQKIDDNENLIGYNCSFDKIEKHIKDTLDQGEDVILGYILTNEMTGATKQQGYNASVMGAPNKVINGHEITVVAYSYDENGKTVFTCVDTDDENPKFVNYKAEWLLPKIHHAGYPAYIVKDDEAEILKNAQS